LLFCYCCYYSKCFVSPFVTENVTIEIRKIFISPVVFYGCGTWSSTLREKHSLNVLQNMVLRNIFRIEIIGGWRKFRNAELYELFFSPNLIGVIIPKRKREGRYIWNER